MSENIAVAVYCILAVVNFAIAEADTLRRWLAIPKRAMSKNRSGKRKMVKTGEEAGKPNQFALGFFLGALITILVSLILGGRPRRQSALLRSGSPVLVRYLSSIVRG